MRRVVGLPLLREMEPREVLPLEAALSAARTAQMGPDAPLAPRCTLAGCGAFAGGERVGGAGADAAAGTRVGVVGTPAGTDGVHCGGDVQAAGKVAAAARVGVVCAAPVMGLVSIGSSCTSYAPHVAVAGAGMQPLRGKPLWFRGPLRLRRTRYRGRGRLRRGSCRRYGCGGCRRGGRGRRDCGTTSGRPCSDIQQSSVSRPCALASLRHTGLTHP